MPITIEQLSIIQAFKRFVCERCGSEYYCARPSKWCSAGCKQASYRIRKNEPTHKERPVTGEINNSGIIPALSFQNTDDILTKAQSKLKEIITLNQNQNGK